MCTMGFDGFLKIRLQCLIIIYMVSTQWYFPKACNIFLRYKTQNFCMWGQNMYCIHTHKIRCIHIHRACVIIYMCRYTNKVLEALPMHKRDTDNLLHVFDKEDTKTLSYSNQKIVYPCNHRKKNKIHIINKDLW